LTVTAWVEFPAESEPDVGPTTVGAGLRLLSARLAAVTFAYGDCDVAEVTVPSAVFAYGSLAQSAPFLAQFVIVI
jgi:hypothetical protein